VRAERFSERDRHTEWYKYIADLRRWEFIKWLGEWFVIVGVIIETLVAGFLARDEWRTSHDALNRPIVSISAVATFRIKDIPAISWLSKRRHLAET
jgi:hypothetical protein